MMEERSFPIYTFSNALDNLKVGHDIERRGLRLRLHGKTIMMIVENQEIVCPWLPTHEDLLANDWRVIKIAYGK